jgi:Icc-related predicted phosphoesterase
MPLRVVAISDTHGHHDQVTVPDGDVLVHCGDYCKYGQSSEVKKFARWLKALPHKHKLVTPGNHDKTTEVNEAKSRRIFENHGVQLLINEEVVIDGIKFWASPITPAFLNWHFMKGRGYPIAKVWEAIPFDVDVLITHGPAYGHGDLCPPYRTPYRKVAGCFDLLNRIREIYFGSAGEYPKVHVFGHIHDGYGATQSDQFGPITFINASVCTEQYQATNPPIVFDVGKTAGP